MGTDVTVVGGRGYIVYIELCQDQGFRVKLVTAKLYTPPQYNSPPLS